MHRCSKNSDPGWCATCYYRDACAAGEPERIHADSPVRGKNMCACDQKNATGVCWWRARYEHKAPKHHPQ